MRLEVKNPCLWRARWKRSACDYRHHPVCRGYKAGNSCIHGYRCLCRQADGKSNLSARSKKKVRQGAVAMMRRRTKGFRISKLRSNEFCSIGKLKNWIERFGGTHLKILRMHLVQNWIRQRNKGNLEASSKKGEPHERNPCAPGFEEQPPEETSLQAGCTSKVARNLARKYASLGRTLICVLIFLWRCQRHRSAYVFLCILEVNAQCWARRIELRYNGYVEMVQKLNMRLTATGWQCK